MKLQRKFKKEVSYVVSTETKEICKDKKLVKEKVEYLEKRDFLLTINQKNKGISKVFLFIINKLFD